MIYLAIIGENSDRYEAEKTWGIPNGANGKKTFDTFRDFIIQLDRDDNILHTAVICLPNCDYEGVKKRIQQSAPNASVYRHFPRK